MNNKLKVLLACFLGVIAVFVTGCRETETEIDTDIDTDINTDINTGNAEELNATEIIGGAGHHIEEIITGGEKKKYVSKILNYYDDGTLGQWVEYEYDDYGNVICEKDYENESLDSLYYVKKIEYTYNEEGNIIAKSEQTSYKDYETGELDDLGIEESKYDNEGNLISVGDPESGTIVEYLTDKDENGNVIKWEKKYKDEILDLKLYVYDENNNVVKYYYDFQPEYDSGYPDNIYWSDIYTYEYDSNGFKIQELQFSGYDTDDPVEDGMCIFYFYDEEGHMTEESHYYGGLGVGGQKEFEIFYTYDENGNQTSQYKYDLNGNEYYYNDEWYYCEYDKDGNLLWETEGDTLKTDFGDPGKEKCEYYFSYKYDNQGNVLRVDKYSGDEDNLYVIMNGGEVNEEGLINMGWTEYEYIEQ